MNKEKASYLDAIKKLTPKQRKYAKLLVNPDTSNQVEAYREAYDIGSETKPRTVRNNASRLARHSGVAAAVDAGIELERASEVASAATRRRWIVDRLLSEAETAGSDSARVRALELLAKTAGLFDSASDRAEARTGATEEGLLAELQARLSSLFPGVDPGAFDPDVSPHTRSDGESDSES